MRNAEHQREGRPTRSAFRLPRSAFIMTRKQRRAERETSAGGGVFRRGGGAVGRVLLLPDSHKDWGFPKGLLEGGRPPPEAPPPGGAPGEGLGRRGRTRHDPGTATARAVAR